MGLCLKILIEALYVNYQQKQQNEGKKQKAIKMCKGAKIVKIAKINKEIRKYLALYFHIHIHICDKKCFPSLRFR